MGWLGSNGGWVGGGLCVFGDGITKAGIYSLISTWRVQVNGWLYNLVQDIHVSTGINGLYIDLNSWHSSKLID